MRRISLALLPLVLAACTSSTPAVSTVAVSVPQTRAPYEGPPPTDDVQRLQVPVTDAQPSRGPADAKVTIVVFSDFQCPFCSRTVPTMERILETYSDVRVVWRNHPLPFHNNAAPAARLAMAAFAAQGNTGFWAAHDLFFENQRELGESELRRLGSQLNLSAIQIEQALAGAHQEILDEDTALSERLGMRGTPGFVINGEQLMGAQPYENFVEVIERARAAADFVIAQGVPPAHVYDALMVGAAPEAIPEPRRAAAAAPERGGPDPDAIYAVPVDPSVMPSRGPADALVTMVVYSDFQCPFCGRLETTLTALLQRYPQDLRVVWANTPLGFHQNAMPAAIAAHEAFIQQGNTGFWAMHDRMFANQNSLDRTHFEQWASEIGLDLNRFRDALDQSTHRAFIEAQIRDGARYGVRGTPASFVNGRNVSGSQPEPAFVAVIEEELTRARALVSAGTPRSGVYVAATANGATSPQTLDAPAAPQDRYTIAVPTQAPRRGASNPQLVIQIFSDFQCPFCQRVGPTLNQVLQQYGTQVQLVWRDYPLPFHNNAHIAAEAAREVFAQTGDAGFWQFHDLLFANQQQLQEGKLETYAQQIPGIDLARFRAALSARTHEAAIDADINAVAASGARIGTPAFLIGDFLLQGAQPFDAFRTAIDAELAP